MIMRIENGDLENKIVCVKKGESFVKEGE
jgi:hypothetical protein